MAIPITHADRTFVALRNAIVEGEILAGSKLNEAELAHRYEVSRAVIREAINRLSTCNLIERRPNVGARVVTLSYDGLIHLYAVREALEGMAARLAAKHMPETDIDEVYALLASHAAEVKGEQTYYQEAGDVDFHYRIIKGSHSPQLTTMLLEGIYHLVRMYRVQLGMAGPRVSNAWDEHKHIIMAIKNRDGELAEMLMRRHIQYSRLHIEELLH
ncbi:GntR family transcriptional regulator [Alteromonas sediminis]|uniref:GntR family transcriptional regulator n=1 Tax=Alteromonas sediminis TaxID=2259342 RepID=A0A3N5Y477_9ALTE|nr:GntR family transcriptional regulator [Alteromonas sediminis]RPJ67883.1 GntR family transcriptional regulator [Alteromonas sediminis]